MMVNGEKQAYHFSSIVQKEKRGFPKYPQSGCPVTIILVVLYIHPFKETLSTIEMYDYSVFLDKFSVFADLTLALGDRCYAYYFCDHAELRKKNHTYSIFIMMRP